MVKGCERRIIHLKNTGCEMFEEAYFILNDKYHREDKKSCDMVKEANRIIEENLCREGLSIRDSGGGGCIRGIGAAIRRFALPSLIGAAVGSVITALIILL